MVDESSPFVELVGWLSVAMCMATSTRSSADDGLDGVLVRLVLEDTGLLV